MSLSHEHVGSKIPAKINILMLTRAELLIHLCYEIPCSLFLSCVAYKTERVVYACNYNLKIQWHKEIKGIYLT